jgi:Flp pilus assembly protein TadG
MYKSLEFESGQECSEGALMFSVEFTPRRPNGRRSVCSAERIAWWERGAAVVEFALALPILLLIAVGTAQFGLILNDYITMTDAVRTGARQFAISRGGDAGVLDRLWRDDVQQLQHHSPAISACSTMQQIASDPFKFFSDTTGGTSSCTSAAHSISDQNQIFQYIGVDATRPRLLPDNTI